MPCPGGRTAPPARSGLEGLGYRLSMTARQARVGFERRLAAAGASFAAWTVLDTLAVHGPMIQRDLAEALSVSGQTMTRQVDRLASAGWLRRLGVEHDRRATLVTLTGEGRALHRRLTAIARQANADLLRGMSKGDAAILDALLSHVFANACEVAEGQPLLSSAG